VFEILFFNDLTAFARMSLYGKWVQTLERNTQNSQPAKEKVLAPAPGPRRPSSRALRPSSSPLPPASPVAGSPGGLWSPALANQVGGAARQISVGKLDAATRANPCAVLVLSCGCRL
jgi:hypothetical protein